MPSILFVCTGNICRSASAEALLRHEVGNEHGDIDSAGTHDYHVGNRPDERALQILSDKNISTKGQVARQVRASDFENFDHIIAMDQGHFDILQDKCPKEFKVKIQMFSAYCSCDAQKNVPDPYYGDTQHFHIMMDMLEEGIAGIRERLY